MAVTLPLNSRSGIRRHARHHLHSEFHLRGALLGRLQLQLQNADADDGGDLVGQRHVHARGHGPRRDVAIEGRPDGGIGQRLFGLRQLRRARRPATPARFPPRHDSGARRSARLRTAGAPRWPARRRSPARCAPFRTRCARRRRWPPGFRSAWRPPPPAAPAPAPIRNWRARPPLREPRWRRTCACPFHPMRDCVWRSAAVASLSCALRLVQPQLRVAMVQLADHLPLLYEVAHVHRRGHHAPGHQRGDVRRFIGNERAGLFEGCRHGAGDGLAGRDSESFWNSLRGGRGFVPAAAGQKQGAHPQACESRFVHFRTRSFFG